MYSTEKPRLIWKSKQGHCPQKPEDNRPQDVYIKGSFLFVESQLLMPSLLYLILLINCDINIFNEGIQSKNFNMFIRHR